MLPVVHTLTGCDSTSKIATKLTALKTACGEKGNLLKQFLSEPFSEFSIDNANVFLVTCLKAKSTEFNFDELRYEIYHKKTSKLELQKFPCASKSLRLHIQRAYFQSMEWNQAAFQNSSYLNPLEYGYKLQDSLLEPIIVNVKNIMPDDFPVLCSCIKCFQDRSCRCRFDSRSCSEFCDCSGKAICNNPFN